MGPSSSPSIFCLASAGVSISTSLSMMRDSSRFSLAKPAGGKFGQLRADSFHKRVLHWLVGMVVRSSWGPICRRRVDAQTVNVNELTRT